MEDQELINPLNFNTFIKKDTFTLDIDCDNLDQISGREVDFCNNFNLDVDSEDRDDGTYLYNKNPKTKEVSIIKTPYNIYDNKSYVKKQIAKINGFSSIKYTTDSNITTYQKPRVLIPNGCYCNNCHVFGPFAHKYDCTLPNNYYLNITLDGLVKSIYSTNPTIKKKYIDCKNNNISKYVNELISEIGPINNRSEHEIVKFAKDINKEYNMITKQTEKQNNISKIVLNILYNDIFNVKPKKNFPKAIIIQYNIIINNIMKAISLRIYSNKIFGISFIWREDAIYKEILDNIFFRINNTYKDMNSTSSVIPTNAFVSVANGSFNIINSFNYVINLEMLYNKFTPKDKNGNIIDTQNFKRLTFNDGKGNFMDKNNVTIDNWNFLYSIKKPTKTSGKVVIYLIDYKNDNYGNYQVTIQIYNTGNVQLTFTYMEENKEKIIQKFKEEFKLVEPGLDKIKKQIEKSLTFIEKVFIEIKDFIIYIFNDIYENDNNNDNKIFQIRDKKESVHENTVVGRLPYKKEEHMNIGNILDVFDDNNEKWKDNFYWSKEDEDRYIVVKRKNLKDEKESFIYYLIPFIVKDDIINGEREQKIIENIKTNLENSYIKCLNSPNCTEKQLPIYMRGKNTYYIIENIEKDQVKELQRKLRSTGDITLKVVEWKKDKEIIVKNNNKYRVYKKSFNNNKKLGEGKSVVADAKDRPTPYSFYGVCKSPNQVIGRIGKQSIIDNNYYPTCISVGEVNKNNVKKDLIHFILEGFTDEEYEEANLSSNETYTLYGEEIRDKYCGTFKPGTTDIGNKITFWNEQTKSWTDGIIVDYQSTHGLGNAKNNTKFVVKPITDDYDGNYDDEVGDENSSEESEIENPSNLVVSGNQLHPKHRESRNFEGLKNIFGGSENKVKDFLIECGVKLGVVKTTINKYFKIEENPEPILNDVKMMLKNESYNSINLFIKNNINRFKDEPFVAAIIPSKIIKAILFIRNMNEQYIIDEYGIVRHISVDIKQDLNKLTSSLSNDDYEPMGSEIFNVILEGYISDYIYYPIDVLYHNNKLVDYDYLYINDHNENDGRLYLLNNICLNLKYKNNKSSLLIKPPLGIKIDNQMIEPFIGPTNINECLFSFVKTHIKEVNSNIIFIAQNNNFKMLWENIFINNYIVLQALKEVKDAGRNEWYLGLVETTRDGIVKLWKVVDNPVIIPGIKINKFDYVKLKLNISDGKIDPLQPCINITLSSAQEAKPFEETKNYIDYITKTPNLKTFMNVNIWIFESFRKAFICGNNSRSPLIEINDKL